MTIDILWVAVRILENAQRARIILLVYTSFVSEVSTYENEDGQALLEKLR